MCRLIRVEQMPMPPLSVAFSRVHFCTEALLDPLTSAILLDKTTGQQQLKVNTGILAPNAQLGL